MSPCILVVCEYCTKRQGFYMKKMTLPIKTMTNNGKNWYRRKKNYWWGKLNSFYYRNIIKAKSRNLSIQMNCLDFDNTAKSLPFVTQRRDLVKKWNMKLILVYVRKINKNCLRNVYTGGPRLERFLGPVKNRTMWNSN